MNEPHSTQDKRVVIIVGGSSGIGRATALILARQKCHLVLAARGIDRLLTTAAECEAQGATVSIVQADVTSRQDMQLVLDTALERVGYVNGWVHTAGVMAYGDMLQIPIDVTARVLDVNTMGVVNAASIVLPQMRGQGHGTFVITGSLLGDIATPFMAPYVTSKWAVHGLARCLQLEQRPYPGVHVCLVNPGAVDTPIYHMAATFVGHHGSPPPPVDKPDKVARAIVRQLDEPRPRTSVGKTNRIVSAGFRYLPKVYDLLVTPLVQRLALDKQPQPSSNGNVFEPTSEPTQRCSAGD